MPKRNFEELADKVSAARHDMNNGIGAIGGKLEFATVFSNRVGK